MLKGMPCLQGVSMINDEARGNANDNCNIDKKPLIDQVLAASVAASDKGYRSLAALFREWAEELRKAKGEP